LAPAAAAAWAAVLARAAQERVVLCLADGKRSAPQQQAVFDDYVQQYGLAMAQQYALPPQESAHVTGLAVDVQPAAAHQWLEATGGSTGFCRRYDNEAWHFEYDPAFAVQGCPPRSPFPGS
jgi:LAS superfamily LD-carboxypeptidase LdcB